jgi:hypothetical protein
MMAGTVATAVSAGCQHRDSAASNACKTVKVKAAQGVRVLRGIGRVLVRAILVSIGASIKSSRRGLRCCRKVCFQKQLNLHTEACQEAVDEARLRTRHRIEGGSRSRNTPLAG